MAPSTASTDSQRSSLEDHDYRGKPCQVSIHDDTLAENQTYHTKATLSGQTWHVIEPASHDANAGISLMNNDNNFQWRIKVMLLS